MAAAAEPSRSRPTHPETDHASPVACWPPAAFSYLGRRRSQPETDRNELNVLELAARAPSLGHSLNRRRRHPNSVCQLSLRPHAPPQCWFSPPGLRPRSLPATFRFPGHRRRQTHPSPDPAVIVARSLAAAAVFFPVTAAAGSIPRPSAFH